VAKIEQKITEYNQRCVDKTGKAILANIGTVSVIKDLESLRAALGDDKLTYLGYSYGAGLGGLYAEAQPTKARAMVLDGAFDQSADALEGFISQRAAFQDAFDDFAAHCAKSPDCPLGTDPAKATKVFHALVDPLLSRPAPTTDPRGLSYPDAIEGTIGALYSPSYWSDLTSGLAALRDGTLADKLLTLAEGLLETRPRRLLPEFL
jgi:pimeloyl-ACP methyl ester carboxylesterase